MTGRIKTVFEKVKPWISSIILLPITIYYIINNGRFTFIDYLNLLIHEGGHGVFKLFGNFIYTLGGTLTQIIIPTMFIVFYFTKRNKLGAQIFLVWLGENFLNISVYASDARAQKLPLLGGNKVYHDWTRMLSQTGLLERDQLVGTIFYVSGVLVFIVALILPKYLKETEHIKLDLKI